MEAIEYEAMHHQEERFWWYRALHEITLARLRQLPLPQDAKLLDAGCGTGGLLRKLSSALPHLKLYGIEHHSAGIDKLRLLQQCQITNGDLNHTPFDDDTFDVIVLNDVLYHSNIDPTACLAESHRILKPGGYLLINVAAYNWMQSTHDQQVHTRERYTAGKLKQQIRAAGLETVRTGYWNSLLFPLMAMHRMTSGKIKHSSDVESLPDWQDNLLYRIVYLEQLMQNCRLFLPFGGSVWGIAKKP